MSICQLMSWRWTQDQPPKQPPSAPNFTSLRFGLSVLIGRMVQWTPHGEDCLLQLKSKGVGWGGGSSTGGHQLRLLSQLGKMICHIKKMCFQCQLKYISPYLCLSLPLGRLCHLNPRKINIKLCWYPVLPLTPCPASSLAAQTALVYGEFNDGRSQAN